MPEQHTPSVCSLLKLHAELGGQLQQNAKQAVSLRVSMKYVEAALTLLQPGFSVAGSSLGGGTAPTGL
jgi:hypothetical protein